MNKDIIEHIAFDRGYVEGRAKYMNTWINIEDEAPEQERLVIYFHDMTGAGLGFYFGRDKEYPSDNDHVFGGNFGWLTGDVTHWCYIPDYPEGFEDHAEANAEYARALKGDVSEMKKPIGGEESEMVDYLKSEGFKEGSNDEFFSREDDAREI